MRPTDARTAIGIVFACFTALGVVACARTPIPYVLTPAPPEARADISRIGILGPPPPEFTNEEPKPGAGWGYLRGVGYCFADTLGVASAAVQPEPIVLAWAIVGCPTIGGLVGVARSPSDAETVEARAALERIGGEGAFGDALRAELARQLAQDAPQYTVALLAPDGTDPLGAPVDVVVALTDLSVMLMQCDRARRWVPPPLTLYAAVDAELRRVDTGAVVHRARFEHWGETFAFAVWSAAGAERFAQGLAGAQRSLAGQLRYSFFVGRGPLTLPWKFCLNQPWEWPWKEWATPY
jgi:hypothetical protein